MSWPKLQRQGSFIFESQTFEREEVTKRAILEIFAFIFYLLGFVSPFVLTTKIFLLELWKMKSDWDTIIEYNVKREWKKWQGELKNIRKVEIARVHHPIGYTASDIASERAYGVVAYLKFQFMKEKPHCSFIMAKNRLAPIKTVSLARRELNSTVFGIRLHKSIFIKNYIYQYIKQHLDRFSLSASILKK